MIRLSASTVAIALLTMTGTGCEESDDSGNDDMATDSAALEETDGTDVDDTDGVDAVEGADNTFTPDPSGESDGDGGENSSSGSNSFSPMAGSDDSSESYGPSSDDLWVIEVPTNDEAQADNALDDWADPSSTTTGGDPQPVQAITDFRAR